MESNKYNDSEYISLRDEIIKRIEMRQFIIALTVTSAGVLLGFSITTPTIAFLYPPLSFFLCLLWAQNDIRSLQISDYLQSLETLETKLGWITFYKKTQGSGSFIQGFPFSVLAPGAVFVFTSIMAIGIGCSKWDCNWLVISFLITDILSVILMCWIVLFVKESRLKRRIGKKKKG